MKNILIENQYIKNMIWPNPCWVSFFFYYAGKSKQVVKMIYKFSPHFFSWTYMNFL